MAKEINWCICINYETGDRRGPCILLCSVLKSIKYEERATGVPSVEPSAKSLTDSRAGVGRGQIQMWWTVLKPCYLTQQEWEKNNYVNHTYSTRLARPINCPCVQFAVFYVITSDCGKERRFLWCWGWN